MCGKGDLLQSQKGIKGQRAVVSPGCADVQADGQATSHVWSYDFVQARTHDGRALPMLTLIEEYSRECPVIDVARRLISDDVLERLSDVFVR